MAVEWNEAFPGDRQPTDADMRAFVNNPLWDEMHAQLSARYGVDPIIAHSRCSGQPGWNMKYKKAGKSLSVLYPLEGCFIALVVIGQKEKAETELMLPALTDYTRALYESSAEVMGGRWLMMRVTTPEILADALALIALRRKPNEAKAG